MEVNYLPAHRLDVLAGLLLLFARIFLHGKFFAADAGCLSGRATGINSGQFLGRLLYDGHTSAVTADRVRLDLVSLCVRTGSKFRFRRFRRVPLERHS